MQPLASKSSQAPAALPEASQNAAEAAATLQKGGRGSWQPPSHKTPKFVPIDHSLRERCFHLTGRWICAREWKADNPKGTLNAFEEYWQTAQHDKEKLKVSPRIPIGSSNENDRVIQ